MASSKEIQQQQQQQPNLGLLANGASGPWEVSIDESTSGAERWFAQIESSLVYLYFEIPSPESVAKIVDFLDPRQGAGGKLPVASTQRNSTVTISKRGETLVSLVRDDEFKDRYFLVVGSMDNPIVRVTIAGEDLRHIIMALRQVQDDLDGDD